MASLKVPVIPTSIGKDGVWIVPVSKTLRLGCLLSACPNPACTCTELSLQVYELDERVRAFGFKKSKIIAESIPLDDRPVELRRALTISLDVYTAALADEGQRPLDESTDRRVAAIAEALDGETLDRLEGLWRKLKGMPSKAGLAKVDAPDVEPGVLVYWDELFEVDRPEAFVDDGRLVVASDMYCVNPECDCREARISFAEEIVAERAPPPDIGCVIVGFDGNVKFEPATADSEPRLRALWARYRRRHPDARVLLERYPRIRAEAQKRASESVGRARRTPAISDVAPRTNLGTPPAAAVLDAPPHGGRATRVWVSTSRKRSAAGRRR